MHSHSNLTISHTVLNIKSSSISDKKINHNEMFTNYTRCRYRKPPDPNHKSGVPPIWTPVQFSIGIPAKQTESVSSIWLKM